VRSTATGPLPVLVGLAGPALDPGEAELLRRYPVAGVVLFRRNVAGAEKLARLCADVTACLAAGGQDRPPLLAADHEGGNVASLAAAIGTPPSALCLGIAKDPDLTRRVHAETARRALALGVNLLLGPVADVVSTGNPVISTRAFGTEPARVSEHVRASLDGLRSAGVLACAKHWPGHGSPEVDSHFEVPVVEAGLATWSQRDLPPFLAAVTADVASIMVGHVRVPALDPQDRLAPVSPPIVGHWLRERLGYSGLVMTDALEMGGFGDHPPVATLTGRLDALVRDLPARVPLHRLQDAGRRVAALRARIPAIGPGEWALAEGVDGADDIYAEARRRGTVALGFEGAAGPAWPITRKRPVRWGLLDAASGDRLLRTPLPGEVLPRRGPASPPSHSLFLEALEARLGPVAAPPVLLPPAGQENALGAVETVSAPPALEGWVVASIRPWRRSERAALGRYLRAANPAWVALLGDLSMQTELGADIGLVLVPGATVLDACTLGDVLTGRIPVVAQGRWGD
jgi:hypothetical protein